MTCRLCGRPVAIRPMREAPQPRFLADFPGNVREDRIESEELMAELIIGIANDMVLLVRCKHQIGERAPDTVEQKPASFALLGFLYEHCEKSYN